MDFLNLNIFKNTSERNDFFIALVVLSLFGLFIGNKMVKPKLSQELSPISQTEFAEAIADLPEENAKPVSIYTDENIHLREPAKTEVLSAKDSLNLNPANSFDSESTPNKKPRKGKGTKDKSKKGTSLIGAIDSKVKDSLNIETLPEVDQDIALDYDSIRAEADKLLEEGEMTDNIENAGTEVVDNSLEKIKETATSSSSKIIEKVEEKKEVAERKIEVVEEKIEKVIPPTPTPTSSTKTTEVSNSSERSSCVIVVGAFKDPNNVGTMQTELIEAGFDYQTGDTGGKRYIGVPVSCRDKTEIQSVKEALLRRLEVKGWLLKE